MAKRLKSRSTSTRILDTLETESGWVTLDELCTLLARFSYPQSTVKRAVYRLVSYGLLEIGDPFETETVTKPYEFRSRLPNMNGQVCVVKPHGVRRRMNTFRLTEAARGLESDWRRIS